MTPHRKHIDSFNERTAPMAKTPEPLDWDQIENEIAAENRKSFDKFDTPAEAAKRAARRQEDFDRGVRLGWWDANGDPIDPGEVDDEETDEEED